MIEVKSIVLNDVLQRIPILTDPSVHQQIGMNLMEGARAMLIKRAGEKLQSTRMDYIQGIQPLEVEEGGISLALVGALPNMVEHGWEGGFLHETLLGSNASGWKTSAEGHRYRSIPFRHKAPGSGKQGGQPMGSQFRDIMSKEVQGLSHWARPGAIEMKMKDLGKRIHGKAKRLITPGEKAAGKRGKTRLPAGLAPKLKQHHTTDIFAGMKVEKQAVQGRGGKVKHQRTYHTFRTISEAVPDKWHHPGIEAHAFFDELGPYIEKNASKAVVAFVKEAMK